jgi:hypothetical protein
VLVYPSGLNVSTQTLTIVTQKLRAHRAANVTGFSTRSDLEWDE